MADTEAKAAEEDDTLLSDNDIEEAPIGSSDPATSSSIPIVVDNGGGVLKAGLCSTDAPYKVDTLVGTPKHSRVMLSAPTTDKFFADLAYKHRGLCRLSYPIQNGIVTNWTDMIQLWQYLYSDILKVKLKEHPLLITEAPLNPISNRIRMTQIYLEYFETPSIYFVPPSVLALYASGRLSGCVLDSGHGVTSCTPIVDGFAMPHAITRMDIGGEDITKYFASILSKIGDYNFQTTSELQTVRIIKEHECTLSQFEVDAYSNPMYHSTGMMGNASSNSLLSGKLSSLSSKLGGGFQIGLGSKSAGNLRGGVLSGLGGGGGDENSPQYTLPDGTILSIGNTHERAAEILFDPAIIGYTKSRGVHHMILDTIMKCDVDVRNRLYDSIYLCGGNCMIKNFQSRLVNEVKRKVISKANSKNIKIRKWNMNHVPKNEISYIGGTLIASNSEFQQLFITKEQFNEYGTGILFRRSLC
mmetsp:Transcript_24986/g.39686  ORF Transcript_24986/g.39686 Transcript_24986/m.39686 type:complete len:470 (-) Transcript_24986:32-1441(-)